MNQRFKHLFRKYLDNSCSREEFNELFAYMEQQGDTNSLDKLVDSLLKEQEAAKTLPRKKLFPAIAVAASILVVLLGAAWWLSQPTAVAIAENRNTVDVVTTISKT
ncbi:hypothetical protein, partial [Flavihumibacter sp. CACIAM 22H1]|uniref:hypothetical protein n=1 Tax=Flavihumibacter sp. CACIAM 22H1 TaxID=1812911 RepID=UPI0025BACD75